MPKWHLITDIPPVETWLMLWLGPEDGEEKPIGEIIAKYCETPIYEGWVEKSVTGNLNGGIRRGLITHWQELEGAPDEAV